MTTISRPIAMICGGLLVLGTAACGSSEAEMRPTAQQTPAVSQGDVEDAKAMAAEALEEARQARMLAEQANTAAGQANRAAQAADAKAERTYRDSLSK